jgi:NTE family protein
MKRKRIAVACQGGGSQCAFIAGALKTLFAREVHHRYKIVGLSGTSGGAITAALAWVGLLKEERGDPEPIEERIIACWKDLSAQTPAEILFDQFSVQTVRLVERGLLPSLANSPSSLRFRFLSEFVSSFLPRREFTDLRTLLCKHIDLGVAEDAAGADSPVLLVGAAEVLEGKFKIFSSALGEITVEALLASAAIPNLFPAVRIDGHAYWDGIFSSNPPIIAFLQKLLMGNHPLPEEIWIIQVNRAEHEDVPETPQEIFDRRNHLAGNLSLQHELQVIAMVNLLLQEQALTPRFRSRFNVDLVEPIAVRFIRMSQELQRTLDYPSKLSRQPDHINRLIAEGESQAESFLAGIREAGGSPEPPVEGAPVEFH